MSIKTSITAYFDKLVEARFKVDSAGRRIFYPKGFGTGYVIPDDASEAMLRQGCRRLMIGTFIFVIPIVAFISAHFQFKGLASLAYIGGCCALGYLSQLYPMWLARKLPKATERQTYSGFTIQSLDLFGMKFLVFGLVTSLLFTLVGIAMALYPPARAEGDLVTSMIVVAIFAPLTAVYVLAIKRRRQRNEVSTC